MIWKIVIFSTGLLILLICLGLPKQLSMVQSGEIQGKNLLQVNIKPEPQYIPKTPLISQIFSNNHSWEATLSAAKIRTVIATGDIVPARSVNAKVLQYKDFNWPYLKTYQLTQDADITFVNLESPQIKNCPVTNEGMIFCGDSRNIAGLKFAGIDIVSLANNHAGNFGLEGVRETVEYLKNAGLSTTGTVFSNLIIKDIRGVKFAFLGFNDISPSQPGIVSATEGKIKTVIAAAKQQADVVITTFHWGAEYKDQPDNRQRYLGHLAVDAGADLVIGNHPHWVQPVEIYKDKLISYAHGNFIFDQMWSEQTKEGVVGKYTFYDNKLIDVQYFPVQIYDYGQPDIADSAKGRLIIERMKTNSSR